MQESNVQKAEANALFSSFQYSQAISTYDRALASVPNYLEYEIAVLKSNIAACHLKLSDWKAAIDEATRSLEALDRLDPPPKPLADNGKNEKGAPGKEEGNDGVIEIDSDGDDSEQLRKLALSDQKKDDIRRIRTKALMRRARARSEAGGWANLQGAEEGIVFQLLPSVLSRIVTDLYEDYKFVSTYPSLSPSDRAIVRTALATLPARTTAAKDKEMGEMMGKLKDLGNGLLKPFGLSTDSFKVQKDPNTGSYSVGMNS